MATTKLPEPTGGRKHLRTVKQTELPDRVAELADAYDRQFDDRDRFLWQWIHSLFPEFTLSSVADEHAEYVRGQKTLLTIYVTVLDDLLETHGDRQTFREARRIHERGAEPDPEREGVDADTLEYLERLWTTFEDGLSSAPRREAFVDVFHYDLRQTVTAIEYSALVSETPHIANAEGARRYDSHNMLMFPYAGVDLMFSPDFDRAEFGVVRDMLWQVQEMARIGNWVTTWERELPEGDYSSGVVVTALEEGIITPAELTTVDPETLVERIEAHDVEDRYRRRWLELYHVVTDRDDAADTVDLGALAEGMEAVYEYQTAARGYK